MTDSEYQKVPKVHRLYQDLQKLLDEGAWVCDAVDHNAPDGCSNPKCFKFKSLLKVSDEFLTVRSNPKPLLEPVQYLQEVPLIYKHILKFSCYRIDLAETGKRPYAALPFRGYEKDYEQALIRSVV